MQASPSRKLKFRASDLVDSLAFAAFPLAGMCVFAKPQFWPLLGLPLLAFGVAFYFDPEHRIPARHSHSPQGDPAAPPPVSLRAFDLLPLLLLPGGVLAWLIHMVWSHQGLGMKPLVVLTVAVPLAVVLAIATQLAYLRWRLKKGEPQHGGWVVAAIPLLLCGAVLIFALCVGTLIFRHATAAPSEPPTPVPVLPEAPGEVHP